VPLAGTWKYRAGTPKAKLTGRKRQYDAVWIPAGLYNGMIAALAPFAIKGVIWYQGEGNAGYSGTYADELARLVRDWRATFGQGDFPFCIVQLAGFGPLPEAPPAGSGWAAVRAAQAQVGETVPHCGSAVAIDRGEIGNIHPPNKREVGERLAATALARTYGLDVPYRGPTYRAMQVEGERMRVTFDHATGLKSLGSAPAGFAIAGADKRFVWAQACIDGESVLVSAPEVKVPVAVRYGWADNALCNLYNRDNFPAVPFRTDSW
jgi:sialate O-acetylesterase